MDTSFSQTAFSQEELANRSVGPSFLTKTGVKIGPTTEDATIFSQRPFREYDTSLSDSLMKIALDVKTKRDEKIAAQKKAERDAAVIIDRRISETGVLFNLTDMLFTQCVSILDAAGEEAGSCSRGSHVYYCVRKRICSPVDAYR